MRDDSLEYLRSYLIDHRHAPSLDLHRIILRRFLLRHPCSTPAVISDRQDLALEKAVADVAVGVGVEWQGR